MNFLHALEEWRNLLGSEYVICETSILEAAQTATFLTDKPILCILRPQNTEEVQQCLKIANTHGVPVYPVSGGKNTGYGSRVPVQGANALMELSRLNRITDLNEDLGYITVESGVTQEQLYQYLQEKQSRLWMDATGASLQGSLVGNTLERGFGHTPYGEHFAHISGMEVVLPTGEIINTGFGQFPNAAATPIYRWGLGPSLDGLFSQSNLGIVTKMTLWLMPKPEYFQAFYFSITKNEELEELINALRPLRLDGTIKSAVHIGNDYKVLGSTRLYPWQEMGGKTPLSAEVLDSFAQSWGYGAWNGSGGLYGTRQQVAESRRLIKKALGGKVRRLQFLDDGRLRLAQRIAKPYGRLTGLNVPELLKLLKPVYGLMQGIPTETQLASAYWRKKELPGNPNNPEGDRCGLLWCAPIIPLDGQQALKVTETISKVFFEYAFEPLLTLSMVTERCLDCVAAITYDREVAGEDERALACYETLIKKLTAAGYYPYRLGIQGMKLMSQGEPAYQGLLQKLKNTLDPQQILAPGRYLPLQP